MTSSGVIPSVVFEALGNTVERTLWTCHDKISLVESKQGRVVEINRVLEREKAADPRVGEKILVNGAERGSLSHTVSQAIVHHLGQKSQVVPYFLWYPNCGAGMM